MRVCSILAETVDARYMTFFH